MVVVHVVYDLRHPKAVDEQDQQSREALHLVDDHYPGQKAAYMCVCMYVHTCYVLISPPMPIHYVLAAVFASCFYVLIYLLQE